LIGAVDDQEQRQVGPRFLRIEEVFNETGCFGVQGLFGEKGGPEAVRGHAAEISHRPTAMERDFRLVQHGAGPRELNLIRQEKKHLVLASIGGGKIVHED
jgi:hypothetical protein